LRERKAREEELNAPTGSGQALITENAECAEQERYRGEEEEACGTAWREWSREFTTHDIANY